jgi:glycosyltransferase involved in cell wall biosynthesis
MFEGKDIICIAMPNWEGDYMKASVQMMSEFALRNRILYVDYEYTYTDVVRTILGRAKAPLSRIFGFSDRLRVLKASNGAEVNVLTPPPVFPTNWIQSLDTYFSATAGQARKVSKSIQHAMRKLNFERPIVINAFNPQFGLPMVGDFEVEKLIYYCYDEISAASWCKEHGVAAEERFIQECDLVVTTSVGLQQAKSKLHSNVRLVPNGVDYSLFHQAFLPLNQKKGMPFTIGYVGTVDDRLDLDLMHQAIQSLPHATFTFVGRVTDEQAEISLKKHANVQLLGPRKPSELPEIMKSFSVGLIPFVSNAFTKHIYPLKVNEYLAAGLPVVSTHFAPLDEFEEIIQITNDPDTFVEHLKFWETHDSEDLQMARAAHARNNTWTHRADQFAEAIEELWYDQ